MTPALVRLDGAGVALGGRQVLQDISLAIHAGERVAVVGANGSGKSTLLRLLHGLLAPQLGRRSADPAQRQSMLFQRPYMLRASAHFNVALGVWLAGARWHDAWARAQVALMRFGLDDARWQNARTLSGGQQQRMAFARAWACNPALFLLDEPTASLDPHAKREIEALMADFAAEPLPGGHARTLVFASHNLGQVKRLATRVVFVDAGRIGADMPCERFFNDPDLPRSHPRAHDFLQGDP